MSVKTDEGREHRLQILDLLRQHKREHGYFPTQQEIEAAMDLSRGSTLWHLKLLRDQGFISYDKGRFARTLKLSRKSTETLE